MNQILTISFVALILASTSLSAQKQARHYVPLKHSAIETPQWRSVYTDGNVVVSINPRGTIKHKDGTYTTHLQWAYTADQPIERGKSYRLMQDIRLLDCNSLNTKTITAYIFDADGKPVSSFDTAPKDVQYLSWEKRKPGTTSANALASVCQSVRKP